MDKKTLGILMSLGLIDEKLLDETIDELKLELSLKSLIGVLILRLGGEVKLSDDEIEVHLQRFKLHMTDPDKDGVIKLSVVPRAEDDYCPTCPCINECLSIRAQSYLHHKHWEEHRKENPYLNGRVKHSN